MRSVIALVLIVTGISACTKPQDLLFIDVQNIRLINLGLTESTVGLDVRLYNPNRQQIRLREAVAKIYANSTYLGDTHMDSTVSVPRRDTFSIPLTMKIPTLTAISKVMQSLSDSTIDIKVQGSVKMGKAGVFINYPINFERRQKVADLKF